MDTVYILFLFILSAAFSIYPDVKDVDLNKLIMFLTYGFLEENKDVDYVEESEERDVPSVPYHKKYLDRFRDMKEDCEIDKEKLKTNMVIEYTPYGNVAMKYDEERKLFTYYSDHSIPYRFLETVAQKFAVQFHCKSLVVDTEKELEKMKKSEEDKNDKMAIDNEDTDKKQPEPEKKHVFAKFKTYNKTSAPSGSNAVTAQDNPSISIGSGNVLELEMSNTYSWEGKLSNMELLQSVKKDAFDNRLKMSYAQFKQMGPT